MKNIKKYNTKLKNYSTFTLFYICTGIFLSINSCHKKELVSNLQNPALFDYISSFTSGVISAESSIKISLVKKIPESIINQPGEMIKSLKFEPDMQGSLFFPDPNTIVFQPQKKLSYGQQYKAILNLEKFFTDVPEQVREFSFQFKVMEQSLELSITGSKSIDTKELRWHRISGTLQTSDVENGTEIEKILSFSQAGNSKLTIHWNHDKDRHTHLFDLDSIRRSDTEEEVTLEWDGKAIGSKNNGKQTVKISSRLDFILTDARVISGEEQYLSLFFSDPISTTQNLNGLIRISSLTTLKYLIESNEIRIFPGARLSGNQSVEIDPGIKNIIGKKLKEGYIRDLIFEELNPAIRLTGKGVILPFSTEDENITIPFEAVNLKSVDIKILKIFENNIAQFLQVNNLDGNSEIKRVGQTIFKKTIDLNPANSNDLYKWSRYSLDLNNLFKADPGSIYQIKLNFRKQQSIYHCSDETPDNKMSLISEAGINQQEDFMQEDESSNWDYYEDYYGEGYEWDQRDNPCHKSYYMGNTHEVSKNILVSGIGLSAKIGSDNRLCITANDIKTTTPLVNLQIEIYDYQKQILSQTITDNEGMCKIELSKKPFLIIAKKDKQRAYLKLDDGSALALSRFDVDGATIHKGLKGFIYGERGVWRPGDTLFLSFILEDKQKKLPQNHPVNFELYNPMGQLVKTLVNLRPVNGFYTFQAVTDPDAPTGTWNIKIKSGGAVFEKTLKIETVLANRLKINLTFPQKEWNMSSVNSLTSELESKWLHGALAKKLKADIELYYSPVKTTFPKYPDFIFDDPTKPFYYANQIIFEGHLDENGKTKVNIPIEISSYPPGKLLANFKCRVFEPGGAFSNDNFSLPVHPYNTYLGIRAPKGDKERGMLLTDTEHTIEIVSLNHDGEPVKAEKIEIQLFKIDWRWWWEKSDEDLSTYSTRTYQQPLITDTITSINGKTVWKFQVKYPEWGRYIIRVNDLKGRHSASKIVYIDWPGWSGRGQKDNPGGAGMLLFSSDKTEYNVGEEVLLTIPSAKNGRAMLSIENGTRIIDCYWIPLQEGTTRYKFKTTSEMAPNVYAHVTMIQPHAQTLNDLPIRMYGIIPVMVTDPATKLYPQITMPDELQPEAGYIIKVSEKQKHKMSYTLAVVDDGLLDLTRFKTPDPWNYFYAKEALGVKTWDLYDEVIGAYNRQLETLLALGGDESLLPNKQDAKANRFKPMVSFIGPFTLEQGKQNIHTLQMSQYIGSVRVMLIAGDDGAYGTTEKTVPVRKALMVLATLPRVAGPGEEITLPVSVFAMKENIRNVKIEIKTTELFSIQNSTSQEISFDHPGDEVVNFTLLTGNKTGVAKVKITARSGNEKAEQEIEIQVRNPNPEISNFYDKVVSVGETWNYDFELPGMEGTNSAVLEISRIPSINLEKRLNYIIQYPYGCVEQTVSSVFPQLFVDMLLDLTNDKKTQIQKNVKAGIDRLRTFQLSDGGFGYWPGENSVNDWCTNYAGHFLLEASLKGYQLPAGMMNSWKNYQRNMALSWSFVKNSDDYIQAYRLYTLALAKTPELGAMNRLKELRLLSDQAKWRLSAAYFLAGQPEAAKSIANTASTQINPYSELSNTYGSELRDQALILETLSLLNEKQKASEIMKEISNKMNQDVWFSTQSTAFCLIAIAKYTGLYTASGAMNYSYHFNTEHPLNGDSKNVVTIISQKTFVADKNRIEIQNNGNSLLFVKLITKGIPITGDQSSSSNDLDLAVLYVNSSGIPIDPSELEQGVDFAAVVTIKNPGRRGDYQNMALSQIFPSGWEIRNMRMEGISLVRTQAVAGEKISIPAYQDIRDDRVYTFFDIKKNETKTFKIILNASYLGKYYLPTLKVEAMYDASISARLPGKWVRVISSTKAL